MNNYNASLQQQPQEFTNQALEVVLKLLNGYNLQMANETPSNLSHIFLLKGRELSTYRIQDLIKTLGNSKMAFVKGCAPMSEVDKIKLAMAKDSQRRYAQTPEAVKLAMAITGIGAYARLCDLYDENKYVQLVGEVCSFASNDQIAHTTSSLRSAQLPYLEEIVNNFAQRQENKTQGTQVRPSNPSTNFTR